MCAKHYENLTMLSKVTAKNVGDVFYETHCILLILLKVVAVVSNGTTTSATTLANYSQCVTVLHRCYKICISCVLIPYYSIVVRNLSLCGIVAIIILLDFCTV